MYRYLGSVSCIALVLILGCRMVQGPKLPPGPDAIEPNVVSATATANNDQPQDQYIQATVNLGPLGPDQVGKLIKELGILVDCNSPNQGLLLITGTQDQVQKARSVIEAILQLGLQDTPSRQLLVGPAFTNTTTRYDSCQQQPIIPQDHSQALQPIDPLPQPDPTHTANQPIQIVDTNQPSDNPAQVSPSKTIVMARPSVPNGDDDIELVLPETLTLMQLIELASEYLQIDYIYDPAKIRNEPISIRLHGRLSGRIKVSQLYELELLPKKCASVK